jgi:glycerol-3-phosphate dehydrogenase (NAD(P)+)
LADLLARNGHQVTIWAFEQEVADSIHRGHENERFLPDVKLHARLAATSELRQAVRGVELLLYAPPSQVLRGLARQAAPYLERGAVVVVATKGVEGGTLALTTQIAEQEHDGCPVVALSGPSFAAEVARNQPTAVVAASSNIAAAAAVQKAFSSPTFRVYTLTDITGVAIGGALKNVIAIATGIADGLGLGDNPRAALLTRALAEITRLGVARRAPTSPFAGLSVDWDLVLTCTGSQSRNRALGQAIGGGATLKEALAGKETVAEGVHTARNARDLARSVNTEMPIVEAVTRILFEGQPAREALNELMTRDLRPEQDL